MTRPQPKKLGPVLATMFVTGNMVGSGLFLLPATLGGIGGISVFTWILATAGALVIAAVFARLGVIAPWAGGPYAYARATLGRYFGFQTNYIYWISCWVGNVGIALAVTGYATQLFPALKEPVLSATSTSVVIWIMVGANIWGPRVVGGLEASAMLIGLAPILVIGLGGWFYFDRGLFIESWNVSGRPAFEAVPASLILVFWAFTGLESAAVAVEVVENPKRNLPIAAVGGVAIAAVIYTVSCTVLMGIVPARDLAASPAPFALVATKIFGPAVATLIVFTTMLKAAGTHGGWTLVSAATSKAAAEDGSFPSVFGRTDRRGIPVKSFLIHGVLMTAAAFATESPTVGEQFNKLIDVSVVFSMVSYSYSAIALCRLRPLAEPGARKDWALAVVALVFSIWVIVASDLELLAIAAIILATSIPLYPFFRGKSGRDSGWARRSRWARTRSDSGMTRMRADFLLLVTAMIWGTAFVAQKTSVGSVPALQFVAGRFLLSALLLAPLARREAVAVKVRLRRRDVVLAVAIGLILFVGAVTQQIGLTTTSVTNAGFITSLYIAFVPFVARLVSATKLRPSVLGACAISLAGAWLLANHGQAARLVVGDFLVLGSAGVFAIHIVLVSKFSMSCHRPFFLSFMQNTVTTLAAGAMMGLFAPVNWPALREAFPAIAYAGLVSGGIGYTLQIVAQRHTPAAEAALIMSMESVFAALAAAILLGERLTLLGGIGCGLILFGVIMVEIGPLLPRRRGRAGPPVSISPLGEVPFD